MKPLLSGQIPSFLDRFSNFEGAVIQDISIISPTQISCIFELQDKQRQFDWIKLTIDFFGIKNARLLQTQHYDHVEIDEGISLIYDSTLFGFCIGQYKTIKALEDASCFIIADTVKYKEDQL